MTAFDWLIILLAVLFYLLPTLVAHDRRHHNWPAILVFNLALGWFPLFWILALVWACTAVRPPSGEGA